MNAARSQIFHSLTFNIIQTIFKTSHMSEPMFVGVKIRPKFLPQTQKPICIEVPQGSKTLTLANSHSKKQFFFDFVLDQHSTQKQLYEKVGYLALDSFLEGIQTTIMAYGRNKTGKTYSLFGKQSQQAKGLIPRIFEELNLILSDTKIKNCMFKVSCVYIMNENLYDLLNYQKSELKLKKNREKKVFVEGLERKTIERMEELQGYFDYISRKKTMIQTKFGKMAINSHTILTIEVQTQYEESIPAFKSGKINFVEASTSFDENKEIKLETHQNSKVNLSSIAFQNVIYGLVNGNETSKIPYFDSMLTELLYNSLGGDTRTIVLLTVDPLQQNYKETIKIMKLGEKISKVQNDPVLKTCITEKTDLEQTLEEIENLKAKMKEKCEIIEEQKDSDMRRQNKLIYRNEFIPETKERDLRFSQKIRKKKTGVQSDKIEIKINELQKRLLKIQKGKFEKERKAEIKEKVKEQLAKIQQEKQKKGKYEEISEKKFENQKRKQIKFIEQQFQAERQEYLKTIRELQMKCSFYQQISENLLPNNWIQILSNNTEYNEQQRNCKVPHFRLCDRRIQFSKKPQFIKNKSVSHFKDLVMSPKPQQSGQKGKVQSSRKSLQFNSRSSHKIKDQHKSFFAPYLTRKTFKTGMKRKKEERESEYYQVAEVQRGKQSKRGNDLLYRSWSQKNVN